MKGKVRLTADAAYEPRLATWLLHRVLPRGVRGDTILGDLIEEWNARVAGLKPSRSTGGARAFQASVRRQPR